MTTSSMPIARARPYLTAIFLWVGTMTLAQATEDPADETGPVVMKAPMPANHEMPGTALLDPMPVASMDPVQPGKRMRSMAKMKAKEKMLKVSAPASANLTLPAFAGASHLYHVGATGYFLKLNSRIVLTADQRAALTQIKASALLSQSVSDRKIETGEQELWLLTAVDSPSAIKITAKVPEIGRERGDERIAFIQAVGEAAEVLTPEQQAQLLDIEPAAPAALMSPSVPPATLTAAPRQKSLTP